MQQHPEMAKMNASSVNTIRIICIMLDGESIPLSAVVGSETAAAVLITSAAAALGGVKPDGHLNDCGYTQKGERYDVHPTALFSARLCAEFRQGSGGRQALPHACAHVRRCFVDIAIDADGEPVLIEYNVGGAGMRYSSV